MHLVDLRKLIIFLHDDVFERLDLQTTDTTNEFMLKMLNNLHDLQSPCFNHIHSVYTWSPFE